MKPIKIFNNGLRITRFPYMLVLRSIIAGTLILIGTQASVQAKKVQFEKFTRPSWWFGSAAGANLNFYHGTTQELNSDLTAPSAFHDGFGVGLFAVPVVEFHPSNTKWGFMIQAGFDARSAKFDQILMPNSFPVDLSTTSLRYLTLEPSLRFNPFKSNFYLFAGPRLAFNVDKRFTYQQGINPTYPEQINEPEGKGVFSNINKSVMSMQIGAGYDILLTAENKFTQIILSPFISYHPYFGQNPRSIESWKVNTIRAGFALKFGLYKFR